MSKFSEDIKKGRKGENVNDPIDNYVWDYAAMCFSRIFIKLHVIPNVITFMSGIVGVAGGILLCFNNYLYTVLAVLLIITSVILDESDGQVARLTKHYSNFGRTLDGTMDFFVYFSIYIGLCVRLFNVNIPFTDIAWGFWIIPLALVALWCFGAQARMLDYVKNLHMYMIKNGGGKHNELSRSKNVAAERKACKKFSFEHFRLTMYLTYTKLQEKPTPKTQKLLDDIEEKADGEVPDKLSVDYKTPSRKNIKFANLLSFNPRTIMLFILLLLPWDIEYLYFAFVICVLEPIRLILIRKYEKLAEETLNKDYFADIEEEKKTA